MPKITPTNWIKHKGLPNAITGQNDGPYDKMALGDVIGLSQYGVHLERLPPGSRSSHRHWHEAEDEFIYMISGQLILVEEEQTTLSAGDAAGWPGGLPIAHCLENRSDGDAVFLVVGTRLAKDIVHYPDHNRIMYRDADKRRFTDLDGNPTHDDVADNPPIRPKSR